MFKKLLSYIVIASICMSPAGNSWGEPETRQVQPDKEPHALSLDECITISINNSFAVKLAKLDLYIAETDIMYAEAVWDALLYGSAGYSEDKRQQISVFSPDDQQTNTYMIGATKTLPTGTALTAEWGDVRSWSNTTFVSKNPSHNAELDLTLEQPLAKNFLGYVDRKTYTLTKMVIENADLETKDRIEQQIATTAIAYIDLLAAKRSLDIFTGMRQKALDLYDRDKKNFDMGIAELVDLYASEANLADREAEAIIARNTYKRAQENLKLIMNVSDGWEIIPRDALTTVRLDRSLPDYLKEAFESRRDYKIRKRDIEIRNLDVKIKENLKWPEVDLTLSMAMNGLEQDFKKAAGKSFVADNTEYYAGIEVTIPVENSAARADYKKAKYDKQKALVSLKETERTIITQVSTYYNNVRAYGESLEFISKAAELQADKLSEEEKRFKYGRSNTKRIIDYQRDLLVAELEDMRYIADHRKAKVDLFRALNVILDHFEEVL